MTSLDHGADSVIHTATDTATLRPFGVATLGIATALPFMILSVTPVSGPWFFDFRSDFP